ncbi:MAG: purine-binding chemotaxis protein CheW [Candidatus Riflebacteria bacterium]|nr:purine-binding chemotaxis protein CheW [Candidatus Riflebacteria bacterium]
MHDSNDNHNTSQFASQSKPIDYSNSIQELLEKNEELLINLEKQTKKVEKLKHYISNLEADGDRLNHELAIANSNKVAFESIGNPMFMCSPQKGFKYANIAFYEMTDTSKDLIEAKGSCCEFLNCSAFRDRCLLEECFSSKKPIIGYECNFISSSERKFKMSVDAHPLINVATGELLGGIEIFRNVIEDTLSKYLLFELAGQEYGIDIKRLNCIISMVNISPVVNVSPYVLGVIDYRNKAITIIDLHTRLGLNRKNVSDKSSILILETKVDGQTKLLGIIADQVKCILSILAQDVVAPKIGVFANAEYLVGIAVVGDGTRIILDVDQILSV